MRSDALRDPVAMRVAQPHRPAQSDGMYLDPQVHTDQMSKDWK